MRYVEIGPAKQKSSAVMLGCMRIDSLSLKALEELTEVALEAGINSFDFADIYGGGRCEELFGQLLAQKPSLREQIVIQSKCGIRDGIYDLSREHILHSTDAILKRLRVDRLELLLLHRPDALMEATEIAEAFQTLHTAGKVAQFGVSNMNPTQLQLLQRTVPFKLAVNQLQFSAAHTGMVDAGINVNMHNDAGTVRDGSILDYCQCEDITVQTWSSLQYGFFEGTFLGSVHYPDLNSVLVRLAEKYSVTDGAIAVAWILRHPARMQAVVGSTSTIRVAQLSRAMQIELTRDEWYEIYKAAGNKLP